jgi:hypothetical protein
MRWKETFFHKKKRTKEIGKFPNRNKDTFIMKDLPPNKYAFCTWVPSKTTSYCTFIPGLETNGSRKEYKD